MPRRHPLAPGMSHHAGTAAGVGTAAPGCCGVLGVGGSAWLFLAGCCGAQEGTSCLPAPAFLLLLLLLSSPALNLVTMATVSTTLQLPREDLPRGGGRERSWGRVLGTWGHCLGDSGDASPLRDGASTLCAMGRALCLLPGGGLWAYFPTPLPFAPSFPPSFPRRPFIPSLTLAHPGPGDNFRSFQLCTLLPSSPVQQVLPFLPVPSPPPTIHPPVVWHRLLAPAVLLLGTARQHVRGHSTGVHRRGGGGCEGGERGHRAPLYFPFFFFIVLNFQFLLILRLSLFCFFPVQRILPSSSPTWGT